MTDPDTEDALKPDVTPDSPTDTGETPPPPPIDLSGITSKLETFSELLTTIGGKLDALIGSFGNSGDSDDKTVEEVNEDEEEFDIETPLEELDWRL